jgi:hypothetical protein
MKELIHDAAQLSIGMQIAFYGLMLITLAACCAFIYFTCLVIKDLIEYMKRKHV